MIASLSKTGAPALALQPHTTQIAQRCPRQASFPLPSAPLSLSLSRRTQRRSLATRVLVNEVAVKGVPEAETKEEPQDETPFQPKETGAEPPSPFEVQSLLMELCDETSIAELKIKVGSFLLHVKRDVGGKATHSAPTFFPPPVPSFPMSEAYAAASSTPAAPSRAAEAPEDEEVDEGLLYVHSPTVGILRRGRIYKGKRGRNLVEAGGTVKAGQVVAYIEQLSTQVAVESEHAGELVAFLADDGVAVGYGDPIISVRPSFPGIKKLA